MIITVRIFFFLSIFLGVFYSGSLRAELVTIGANEIFNKMVQEYSDVKHYKDKGVRTIYYFKNTVLHHKDIQKFETSYKKPGDFKFQWTSYKFMLSPQFNYIESLEGKTQLKIWDKELVEYASLNDAVSRVTGITGKAAYWLPKFLLTEIFCPDLSDLELKLIGSVKLDGHIYYELEITYETGSTELLWINKKDFTLAKIMRKSASTKFNLVDEIVYSQIELKK